MKTAKKPTTPDEPALDVIKKALKLLKVKYDVKDGKGLYRRAVVSYDQGHTTLTIRIPIEHLKVFMKNIGEKHGLEYIRIPYSKWGSGVRTTGHNIYFYASIERDKLNKFSKRLLGMANYIKETKT